MIGVYFSGTGNTRHCLEYLLKLLDGNAMTYSIENETATSAIQSNDEIVFAYPVYYSYLPKIVYDFINNNSAFWKGKKVLILPQWDYSAATARGAAQDFSKSTAQKFWAVYI